MLSYRSVGQNSFGVNKYVHAGIFAIFVVVRKNEKDLEFSWKNVSFADDDPCPMTTVIIVGYS